VTDGAATTLNVLGIAGSLRRGSHNRMALRAAQRLAPAGMVVEAYEGLGEIPPYDEDVRAAGLPAAVEDLRRRIAAADALLLVTPEYNYSVPGVLKNAIDWASRPPDQPFEDKPVAIMSASPSTFGGVRAQYHLRQCFVYLDAKILNRPEVFIGQCGQKFAEDGTLTDEATARHIGAQLEALAAWTRRLKGR
jgi:chromate reductase, NAD(P)H dehydrogenase (quinone)